MQIYLIVLDLMLYFKVHLTCSIRKVSLNSLNLKQPTPWTYVENENQAAIKISKWLGSARLGLDEDLDGQDDEDRELNQHSNIL